MGQIKHQIKDLFYNLALLLFKRLPSSMQEAVVSKIEEFLSCFGGQNILNLSLKNN